MIRLLLLTATICWLALPPVLSAEEDAAEPVASEIESDGFDEFSEFGDDSDVEDAPRDFDPLRGYNRFMFSFNDKAYFWVMKPIVQGYGKVVPESARRAVHRCVINLGAPVRFVNTTLQFKLRAAGAEAGRFVINTTIGIVGLFDPAASHFGLNAPPKEDLGQTLGHYGIGTGFPIVLPLLGPSNLRDTLALAPDWYFHPFSYLDYEISIAASALATANFMSLNIGEYELLKESAIDAYTMFKDGYKQQREAAIRE